MGPFHMARILQKCAGKLLRGSGLDDLMVECGAFGQDVMETVLTGKHYYTALAGLLILEDLIVCMQWNAFFLIYCQNDYTCIPDLQNQGKSLAKTRSNPKSFMKLLTSLDF